MHRVPLYCALLMVLAADQLAAQNLGHRMGGDVYPPENTLHCYEIALAKLQDDPDFHYVELDIQESGDGEIVVFHDTGSIHRMVPQSRHNLGVLRPNSKRTSFDEIRIRDLTLKQIQGLVLSEGAGIPTLKEVLDASVRWGLRKPMLIEIKSLRSDACRNQLLSLVAPYRKTLTIDFLAFPGAFRSSFPDQVRWKAALKRSGFKVYTARKPKTKEHDLASDVAPADLELEFRTLIPETDFAIREQGTRSLRFPISVPELPGAKCRLRVGIEHGYDDTGDRSVRYRILDGTGQQLTAGSSRARGWQWFELPSYAPAGLTLLVEDEDTDLSGKHPGNAGRIKVSLTYPRGS
ncbi:MAG: hypothetical protein KDB53_10890 [Planctomycetes bacterium]|nr:hypothetical protein [Planctomycetota bacterium]